ncbi:MAG: group III truncated hemoglobin [Steroidobacteraceae bacterium]
MKSSISESSHNQNHSNSYANNGIDEALIERVVRLFYITVRADTLLGPIFSARIPDWEPHLQRMFAFWSSVTLSSGRYHGHPMQKHAALPIDARHFDQWLALFITTVREVCPPVAADQFIARAKLIASSLEMGRAAANGELLQKGQRFIDSSLVMN